jgi:FkbM family methyltransferase
MRLRLPRLLPRRPPARLVEGGLDLLELTDFAAAPTRSVMEAAIRARCHTVAVDEQTVLCRVLGRYKFLVDRRDEGLAPHLMLDGYWEYWTTDFIARRLRPGQVACDVGANLGYFSVLMAELVGPAGKLHAVEPNPRMSGLLARNLALNGFTAQSRRHVAAASDTTGLTLRFQAHAADPKNGHLVPPGAARRAAGAEEFAVPSMRLDDIAGPVDFVKIDVEGAEEAVWAGMQGLLDRSPDICVLMEVNAGRCADPAGLLTAIAARFPLRELGLECQITPVTAAAILARGEDTLLMLEAALPGAAGPAPPIGAA